MAKKKVEEPKYVIQVTTEQEKVSYFKKFVTLKRVQFTDQLSLATHGPRAEMIGRAVLLRQNGVKAWAIASTLTPNP